MRVTIVGAGVFGVSTAVELRRRGHDVTVLDRHGPPAPDAASTDISKLVRLDYGDDGFYVEHGERAMRAWTALNSILPQPLYHETGLAVLTSEPMVSGGFEHDSRATLAARRHPTDRVDAAAIARRLPQWRGLVDGYLNPRGGWVEASAVVAALADLARRLGARFEQRAVVDVDDVAGDAVVVAAGAWSRALVPELRHRIHTVGQPVFTLRPADPSPWGAPGFLPWTVDIASTGWYGFPATADGIVKIANHGPGLPIAPDGPRHLPPLWEGRLRTFLHDHLPALADVPLHGSRVCLYTDSIDGDFFICRHPHHPRLVLATGGSGHAFKFAPLLGGWVADVVDGRAPEPRFAWRERTAGRKERARQRD